MTKIELFDAIYESNSRVLSCVIAPKPIYVMSECETKYRYLEKQFKVIQKKIKFTFARTTNLRPVYYDNPISFSYMTLLPPRVDLCESNKWRKVLIYIYPQAFMELQGKMQETNQKLRIADVQVESLKKQIVHAQLTDKEIQVSIFTRFL